MSAPPSEFLAAAVEVLRVAGRPLTSREIVEEALRRGLLPARGKTPEKSMTARLYTAVRDDSACPIERRFEPGAGRARRGSVRWALRSVALDQGSASPSSSEA